MSRELRTRARARIQPGESDESDDSEADEDVPAQIPSTSIQDLINPADAQQFDQTFSDADANLNIEGAFDPVAGPKQVIPRVAYVLNFNLLYNEQQERWEPQRSGDTGNSGSGGLGDPVATGQVTVAGNSTATDSLGLSGQNRLLLERATFAESETFPNTGDDVNLSHGGSQDFGGAIGVTLQYVIASDSWSIVFVNNEPGELTMDYAVFEL